MKKSDKKELQKQYQEYFKDFSCVEITDELWLKITLEGYKARDIGQLIDILTKIKELDFWSVNFSTIYNMGYYDSVEDIGIEFTPRYIETEWMQKRKK